ncbi:DUF1028 domain-containing protein [Vibrio kyushuensis]|uniref:DUF1028 domain-containing protein n=1 Tax=Vibrio kyushuensis TaxID=2910249 RepID=UPI003D0B998C
MTISLVHFNPETGLSASLSATGGVSVGGYVNHSWRGLGGCATQGLYTNPWYAEYAKSHLTNELSCDEVIELLKQQDSEFHKRQCMVMDRLGNSAFIHGESNIAYTGSVAFPHIAVAGNMLESETVLTAFITTFTKLVTVNSEDVRRGETPIYKEGYERSLPEMLITSLESALLAGGDKRGTYSASLRVESMTQAPIDIRVDWSDDSLILDMRGILRRVRAEPFDSFLSCLPTK